MGYPVVTEIFTPFAFYQPFAYFPTYYSTSVVDISVVIQAMTSSFAFLESASASENAGHVEDHRGEPRRGRPGR